MLKITPLDITIRDLTENYKDDGDGGVYGYNDHLKIRPEYQREFIYRDKERNAVIDSVMKERPLSVMYWDKIGPDSYQVLDGQ